MSPALLVLAAGMGSRYGGIKQIDPAGAHNTVPMTHFRADIVLFKAES